MLEQHVRSPNQDLERPSPRIQRECILHTGIFCGCDSSLGFTIVDGQIVPSFVDGGNVMSCDPSFASNFVLAGLLVITSALRSNQQSRTSSNIRTGPLTLSIDKMEDIHELQNVPSSIARHIEPPEESEHPEAVVQQTNEHSLPPCDGGGAAWRLLFTAFVFECLLWGELDDITLARRMTTETDIGRVPAILRCFPELLRTAAAVSRQSIRLGSWDRGVGNLVPGSPGHDPTGQALRDVQTPHDLGRL